MEFYRRKFNKRYFTLYPIGDFHLGSPQCNEDFVKQVIKEIKNDENGYWVGMGDMMENAIVGSLSDVYTQTIPPKEQMEYIVDLLRPIKDKGLFLIGGNHEFRTHRIVGLIPEQFIGVQLGIPYKGFSCLALFEVTAKTPFGFECYFHHNYGGGYTAGGKVNKADSLRKIVPTADAIFSAHFHITSRIPVVWYGSGRTKVIKHIGYDYIIGSSLEWDKSYAEEKAKPAATCEFIRVKFVGNSSGRVNNKQQIFEIIQPIKEKEEK